MNKKGIILQTVAVLLLVIVIIAISKLSRVENGQTTIVGEKAAQIREMASRAELDKFALIEGIKLIKVHAMKDLAENGGFFGGECKGLWSKKCNPNEKISESYLKYFKQDFENFWAELFLYYQTPFEYSTRHLKERETLLHLDLATLIIKANPKYSLDIKENKILLGAEQNYKIGSANYSIKNNFESNTDFSMFGIYETCAKEETECGKYDKACGECKVSEDGNDFEFKKEIDFEGEKLTLMFKTKRIKFFE